jgi:ribonucleotide monophosphatase NagD (HAD superfamily)
MEDFENYKLDPRVQAVVVGLDTKFTYSKLAIASLYINTGGAKFIATNDDAFDMVGGRMMPGAGGMVASISCTLD